MIEDVEAVAKVNHPPIVVHDSAGLASAAGPGPGAVVLQTAHHVIEWLAIVRMNLIELPKRDVVHRLPRLAVVVRDGKAAIFRDPQTLRILRIAPECVIVDVNFPGD